MEVSPIHTGLNVGDLREGRSLRVEEDGPVMGRNFCLFGPWQKISDLDRAQVFGLLVWRVPFLGLYQRVFERFVWYVPLV